MTCTRCEKWEAIAQLVGTGEGKGSTPAERGVVFYSACGPCKADLGERFNNAAWIPLSSQSAEIPGETDSQQNSN